MCKLLDADKEQEIYASMALPSHQCLPITRYVSYLIKTEGTLSQALNSFPEKVVIAEPSLRTRNLGQHSQINHILASHNNQGIHQRYLVHNNTNMHPQVDMFSDLPQD